MYESKAPPNDVSVEKSILGVLLIEPRCIPDVVNKLSVDFFYNQHHQIIYLTIVHLYDKTIAVDLVTVVII